MANRTNQTQASTSSSIRSVKKSNGDHFFVWREFLWGGIAGAFGEGIMHPVDTVKTRIQSQAILSTSQTQRSLLQMLQKVWVTDGLKGFYRGIAPGVTGSLATGATYFGFIESTKKWIEESHPGLGGYWAHFIAGGIGDTLGSFVYVPCEVIKQRMQVQGTSATWKSGSQVYDYYTGMLQAGNSICREQGIKGLYAGYGSTLARDVPFAGLMVMFYESLKDASEHGKKKWNLTHHVNNTFEGLILGGLAGGLSAYLTTPFDVIKTRMQVQGSTVRYKSWFDAIHKIWKTEGAKGMFRGSIPRVTWYIPASALTFTAVEFLREHFNDNIGVEEVTSISIERKRSLKEEAA
ncbi:uncharacterized protein [Rutidosis leptorrhynchoides]|uniref:uncharacterized protein n=1 Tax=Rutidosis leptorrhynchoides TaxID=125765 RepID=UPI003A99707C